MRSKLSAAAAFGNTFWTAALQLVAVRMYVSLLGVEAYGVVGFFVSLQGLLQVLDAGLAPAVNRELARSKAIGQMDEARSLLGTLSVIYWCTGLLIAVAIIALSSTIAISWLNASQLGTHELTEAIMLMGVIVAVRWPVAVYYNAMVGLAHLSRASLFNAVLTTVNITCSVAALTFYRADLPTLFTTQAIVALVGALVIRRLAWSAIGGRMNARFQWAALSRIWRFSLGMGGVALTSVVLTQIDKVILSRLLPLKAFGEYMVAVSLTSGLMLLVTPLVGIIFPRFSALVAKGQNLELRTLYRDGSQLFGFLFLPIVLAAALYGREIVWVWTGHYDTALRAAPIVALLALGYGINGLMFFPFSLQLALGLSRLPLMINIAMLIVMVPLVLFLTTSYGAIGGAAAWPILQIVYLVVGTVATHRRSDQGSAFSWILQSVAMPAMLALAVMLTLRPLVLSIARPFPLLIGAGASVLMTYVVAALVHPKARLALARLIRANQKIFMS